jgi:large subunit ribosomal protein L13
MKTYTVSADEIEREWWVVDAEDEVLGRLATRVASVLRGKHKPTYSPHLDVGDHVVVVNAEKIRLTGDKEDTKTYFRHSGWMGGDKHVPFERMRERRPEYIIERAVQGMLPKTKLGREMRKKLRVYAGPDHPHEAQTPEPLEI